MAKTNPIFSIESFGIYECWTKNSKSLPKIKQFTTLIPATIDIEFGLTLHVKKAKGININWYIEHPNIHDKNGNAMAAFSGTEYVRNNDWKFYLGDTIWPPQEDKLGDWRMYIKYQDKIVAEKVFDVNLEDIDEKNLGKFWKRRGF